MADETKNRIPQADDPRKEQRRKTFYAALIMLVPFGLCLYLIFGNGEKTVEGTDGINTTLPDGRSRGIVGDKIKAVEAVRGRNPERVPTLGDNSFSLVDTVRPLPAVKRDDPVRLSQEAYRTATREMATFYDESPNDLRIEELQQQVADLTEQLQAREKTPATPDPMELAEKQYALAAKYLHVREPENPMPERAAEAGAGTTVKPVRKAVDPTVSMLPQPYPDTALQAYYATPRNYGFLTAVGSGNEATREAIHAVIDADQTVTDGARVTLRLTQPVVADETVVQAGTLLYGIAAIEGQRLTLTVQSISGDGSVIPVNLAAYDTDGQPGLFIPDSRERTAAKDAAANIGAGFGSSVSFARTAGQQVAMDLVRGALTGGSQYIASKIREVKVSVKAGYRVLLIPQN